MKPTEDIEAVRAKLLELMAERNALQAELGYNEASTPTDERWLALQARINPLADAIEKHDKNEELRELQAQEKALSKWLTPTQKVLVEVRREQINARWVPGGTAIRECEQRAAEYDRDRFTYGFQLDEPNHWGLDRYAERERDERLMLRYSAVHMAAESKALYYQRIAAWWAAFIAAATLVWKFWF